MKDTMTILEEAWKKTLTTDYQEGILSYERDLQAAFYHHARRLSGDKLKLFNEAAYFLKPGKPDLVVCRNKAVDAVIEFKFLHEKVKFEHDLDKLVRWANTCSKASCEAELALDPTTLRLANDDDSYFTVSAETNYVFAVVTRAGEPAASSTAVKEYLRPKRKNVPWCRFWHFTGIVSSKGELRCGARHL